MGKWAYALMKLFKLAHERVEFVELPETLHLGHAREGYCLVAPLHLLLQCHGLLGDVGNASGITEQTGYEGQDAAELMAEGRTVVSAHAVARLNAFHHTLDEGAHSIGHKLVQLLVEQPVLRLAADHQVVVLQGLVLVGQSTQPLGLEHQRVQVDVHLRTAVAVPSRHHRSSQGQQVADLEVEACVAEIRIY